LGRLGFKQPSVTLRIEGAVRQLDVLGALGLKALKAAPPLGLHGGALNDGVGRQGQAGDMSGLDELSVAVLP
jgi:hypothetical protein